MLFAKGGKSNVTCLVSRHFSHALARIGIPELDVALVIADCQE
jgi:hypothetical protein